MPTNIYSVSYKIVVLLCTKDPMMVSLRRRQWTKREMRKWMEIRNMKLNMPHNSKWLIWDSMYLLMGLGSHFGYVSVAVIVCHDP